ncbi:MAG: DUF885 family protein [Verrucomicrobia bacterium]|nr:DUF885 family protein [Verrucomicrobiota bacterium]
MTKDSFGASCFKATLAALALLTLPGAVDAAQRTAPKTVDMADLVREFEADDQSVSTFYDLPRSAVRFDRLEKLYKTWQARLAAVDFDALGQAGRVDCLLLRNALQQSLAEIARERGRVAEMDHLLIFRGIVHELEQSRWRGEPANAQTAAAKVAELTKQAKQLKERVEKGVKAKAAETSAKAEPPKEKKGAGAPAITVSATLARRAAGAVAELRGSLKKWFGFYDGYQPDFQWWVKKPYEEADKQLEDYAKFIREEVAGLKGKDEDPLVGDPIGAGAVAEAIRFEFLPYTAEELIAIGERQMAWGEREMKAAARAMGCGDDWKAALAKVKADFVPPGQQDDFITKTAREAVAFVKKHKFATVPPLCEETWRLTMMSPETMKTIPYAAYGGQNMMVAYAKDEMKQEDKLMVMRGNNRAFSRLTTAHELVPGHHLQNFQAARHNTHRRIFSTPFYVEGWALYCELRFWDFGWARSPQERIGMLFWRMNRAARIIVSLKFHLGQMKPAEMVDFLVNRVGHEKLGATSEVRRFVIAPPLYQAGYMLGGLQLKALHDEMVRPGKLTEQQFNDAVLAGNTMPIELLRAALLKLPLARDAQPSWKFAGENPAAERKEKP